MAEEKKNENKKRFFHGRNNNQNKNNNNKPVEKKQEQKINNSNVKKTTSTTVNKQVVSKPQKTEKVQNSATNDKLASIMQNPIRSKFNNNKSITNKTTTSTQKVKTQDVKKVETKPVPKPSQMKAVVENKSGRERNVAQLKRERLKIIPLGGLEEVGKNITVFEYGNDIIIVDCGVSFPEEDMLGVDLVTPDISYLIKIQSKI